MPNNAARNDIAALVDPRFAPHIADAPDKNMACNMYARQLSVIIAASIAFQNTHQLRLNSSVRRISGPTSS
jgi:hypothetical protein